MDHEAFSGTIRSGVGNKIMISPGRLRPRRLS